MEKLSRSGKPLCRTCRRVARWYFDYRLSAQPLRVHYCEPCAAALGHQLFTQPLTPLNVEVR